MSISTKLETFNQSQLKQNLPDLKPGDTIKVYQKIKEGEKEKIQVFEGQILAVKHGKGINATITVRKTFKGIGVERIFPLHSSNIEKIEISKRVKTKRAKLYYIRQAEGRKTKFKNKEIKDKKKIEAGEKTKDAPKEEEGVEKRV